jgi:hypothetical protein
MAEPTPGLPPTDPNRVVCILAFLGPIICLFESTKGPRHSINRDSEGLAARQWRRLEIDLQSYRDK